jgi:hypothetical protein
MVAYNVNILGVPQSSRTVRMRLEVASVIDRATPKFAYRRTSVCLTAHVDVIGGPLGRQSVLVVPSTLQRKHLHGFNITNQKAVGQHLGR